VAIQISLRASRGRRTNHQEVRTDREGRFRYVPVEPIDAQATDHKLFVGLASDRRYPVVTPLPRVLPPGETDVGDVVWEVPPLLVSGVVVDGLGRPVAGARISVYSGRTRLHRQWTSIGDSSDEAGRFEVYADVQASPLSAEAAREGYYPGPRAAFEAPASQLRVLLHSSSTIEGKLLLDPRVPTELVTVEAVIESEDNAARPARVSRSDHPEPGTGGFRIDALPPGRARVEVQRTGTSTPLVAFDSVALLEGEPVRDARLDLIDLRGMLFAIRVAAVDEAGAPIGHARAAALGTVGWWRQEEEVEGLWVLADRLPIDLEIGAGNYISRRFEAVSSDLRVVLRPQLSVRLVSDEFVFEQRTRITSLVACLHKEESEHESAPLYCRASESLSPEGEVNLRLESAGSHWLYVNLLVRHGFDEYVELVIGPSTRAASVLGIADVDEEQVFAIELRAEQVEAAQRRIEARIEAGGGR